MRLRWTTPALRDLEEILDRAAAENPKAAARLSQRVFELAERLAQYPHLGRPGRVEGTRELVVTGSPYIMPYRIGRSDIEVLAVFHGARKWPDAFM